MKATLKWQWSLLLILMIHWSCSNSDEESNASISCSGVTVSFASDVSPIIKASCTTNSSCHASGSNEGPGALTTYAQVYSARVLIKSTIASGEMPKNGSLASEERNKIICWIENAATDN
jgi:uncharacterized membrane protein